MKERASIWRRWVADRREGYLSRRWVGGQRRTSRQQSAKKEKEENKKITKIFYVRFSSISSQYVTRFRKEKEGKFKNLGLVAA